MCPIRGKKQRIKKEKCRINGENTQITLKISKYKAKIVVISAEDIAGKANTEHIARVLTLDDLFI